MTLEPDEGPDMSEGLDISDSGWICLTCHGCQASGPNQWPDISD
jgi:hypothetical protein